MYAVVLNTGPQVWVQQHSCPWYWPIISLMATLPLWNSTMESDRKVVGEKDWNGIVKGHWPDLYPNTPIQCSVDSKYLILHKCFTNKGAWYEIYTFSNPKFYYSLQTMKFWLAFPLVCKEWPDPFFNLLLLFHCGEIFKLRKCYGQIDLSSLKFCLTNFNLYDIFSLVTL